MVRTARALAVLFAIAGTSAWAQVENYKIDPSHTSVVFKAGHLGFSHTYGMFPGKDVEGTFQVDEKDPGKGKIELKIKADSIMTFDEKRDKHLKSPDFFNSKQNPLITFTSTQIKKVSGNQYSITGNLSMNGVTKPITFDFHRGRTGKDPWGNVRTGGDATFKVKRSDYKMNYMLGNEQIPDDVELMVSLEGIKQ